LAIIVPLFFAIFLKINKNKLHQNLFTTRIGTFYLGVKLGTPYSIYYNVVFVMRRLFLAILIVFFDFFPGF